MRPLVLLWFVGALLGTTPWTLTATAQPPESPPPSAESGAGEEPSREEFASEEPAREEPPRTRRAADVPAAEPAPPAPQKSWAEEAQAKIDGVAWGRVGQLALLAVLSVAWIAATDWVNRDSQIYELGYKKWNPIVFFPCALLLVGLAFVPMPFYVRLGLIAVAYLATIIPYVVVHNRGVEPHQTVLTAGWWRHVMAALLTSIGIKVSGERAAAYEKGAPVDLIAMGASDPNVDNANLIKARQSPGYLLLKDLIVEMVKRRAERVMLDYGQAAVAVRYEIDGVWHADDARDRESSDVMLAVMKTLANLNMSERRKKQEGKFAAKYEGRSYLCPVVSQGVPSGERVVVTLLGDKSRPTSYEDLGMREGLRKEWEELMALDRGLLVFSTMPGGGLTTITDVSLDETDRLMRDFVAIEDVHHREREIQNINVTTYDSAAGQSPITILPKLIRTYPNVYILRDFSDVAAAKSLMTEIQDERLVITGIPARDGAEALVRMLKLKIPQKLFASAVTAVLYQRLIRKLCPDCKVGYPPPPDVLKRLGIPVGKVQQLFRPPKPEEIEKPCLTCRGLGYQGRTGLFELIKVNDAMREILAKQPSADLLRKAARAAQQRSLQEEGILLVARGVTSLPELMRVLKTETKK
jgi:type II secretory ATPase GspE/PulE/Tfp pilus assembly ATPase PilB-like protein